MALDLLSQLQKRRLFRVAAGYLAAAFVVLQAVDLLSGAFDNSPRLLRALVMIAAAGFPIALFVGWFVRRDGTRLRLETIPATGRQHGIFGVLVLLLTLTVGLAGWTLWGQSAVADGEARDPAAPAPNRVAVLYLDNHNPGGEDQYLADGLTEALIHELSGIDALEVISRNGVKPFRGERVSLDSVISALRPALIVEGSVQRSGDRIRVVVQLIDAVSKAHVGSKVLERPMSELFALQDAMVAEIGSFLRSRIGDQLRVEARRRATDDLTAWAYYHRALRLRDEAVALLQGGLAGAAGMFEESRRLAAMAEQADQAWAAPTVLRARTLYDEAYGGLAEDPSGALDALGQVVAIATEALGKDSLDAEAFELRGTARYLRSMLVEDGADAELTAASADLHRAVEIDRSRASAWATLSHYYMNHVGVREGQAAALRAYEADAFLENASLVVWRLFSTSFDGLDADGARRWCEEGSRRFPDDRRFHECRIWNAVLPDARASIDSTWAHYHASLSAARETPRAAADSVVALTIVGVAIARAGESDSARAVLGRVSFDPANVFTVDVPAWRAFGYLLLGDTTEAARQLAAYDSASPGGVADLLSGWMFRDALDHPLLQQLGR